MAKVRIIACDGQHPDGLVPAAGRVGVQRDDQPVVWKDYCEACLEQVVGVVGTSVPLAQRRAAGVIRGPELEQLRGRVRQWLARQGEGVTGREVMETFQLSKSQMMNVLHGMADVRRTGWSKGARFFLRGAKRGEAKGKVKHAA